MIARRHFSRSALVLGIVLWPIASATASVWPTLGGSVGHPSTSPFLGPATNTLAWEVATNAAVDGGVAIDGDGSIYFGTANGRFYALEQNGQERWMRKNFSPVIGVPAIGADDRVYVGVNSGTAGPLYAFDRRSGAGGAIFTTDSPLVGSPAFHRDGTILLATRAKGVFAVSPTGTLRWVAAVGKIEASSPAIGADGAVYVGTADGRLVALEPNGSVRWSRSIASKTAIVASPTVGRNGRIFVGASDGGVRALDGGGTLLWTFAATGAVRSGVSLGPDDTIYFGADDRKVYHLSDAGVLLWATLLGGAVRSTPVVDRAGAVYVGADDQRVHALDAAGGARWSFATGGAVRSALAIGVGGRLFVGSNDRSLYALGEFRFGPECWSDGFIDPDGLSEEEADRRLQILLAACGGPSVDSCEAEARGAVNADRVAAARRIVAGEIDPAEYLAILRDRTRKLSALRQGTGSGFCEVAVADADRDLVPDPRDLCPGTPWPTPTLENGCPDPTLPDAPSNALVHQFLDRFGFAFDPHCDDTVPRVAPVLGLTIPFIAESTLFIRIIVAASDDQPLDCGAFYEIEAFVPRPNGTRQSFYMVFRRSQAETFSFEPGKLFFPLTSDDPAPYGAFVNSLPLDADARSRIRMRARVTTYGGVRSVWSSM